MHIIIIITIPRQEMVDNPIPASHTKKEVGIGIYPNSHYRHLLLIFHDLNIKGGSAHCVMMNVRVLVVFCGSVQSIIVP